MTIQHAALKILGQLTDVIHFIQEEDFSRPSKILGGGTIGQHIRHTLEFFLCLEEGMRSGVVSYDRRSHDKQMETSSKFAGKTVNRLASFIQELQEDAPLQLEAGYASTDTDFAVVETTLMRELVYNIEHAVHHMAFIRIAVRDIAPYIVLDEDFGIAASTLRYANANKRVL